MSGPAVGKGTKERSFWNREREQDLVNLFRDGLVFLLLVVQGHDRKGKFKMIQDSKPDVETLVNVYKTEKQ